MKRFLSLLITVVMITGIFSSVPLTSYAVKKEKVGLKKSSATIYISVYNGKASYGTTTIKVKKAKGVSVKKTTFKSSDKKTATVNKKGKVTAVKKGKAKISVKVKYRYKKKNYTKNLKFSIKVKRVVTRASSTYTTIPETTAEVKASEIEKTTEAPETTTAAITEAETVLNTDPPQTLYPENTENTEPASSDNIEETYSADDRTPSSAGSDIEGDTCHCIEQESEPYSIEDDYTTSDFEPSTVPEEISESTEALTKEPETIAEVTETEIAAEVSEPETAPEVTEPETTVPQTFESRLVNFSNKLYNMSAENEDENYTMSPISVYMAFSMLYSIGDENVKSELETLTGMTAEDFEKAGELFDSLQSEVTYDEKLFSKLSLTNSIWINEGEEVNWDKIKELLSCLGATSHETPFFRDNEKANKDITEFVKENTNGLIDKDFKLTKETLFALINTLYFKDIWSLRDGDLYSKEDNFYLNDGSNKKCEFLYGKYVEGQTAENELCSYFYTETQCGYKLKFILPKEGVSLKEAMSAANLNAVNSVRDFNVYAAPVDKEALMTDYAMFDEIPDVVEHKTRCIFPSFKIQNDTKLKEILEENGYLEKTFEAFLSPITEKPLLVGDIKHTAVLDVNKTGIEGAAVTIISVEAGSALEFTEYHELKLDRSFGFILTDLNDTILFEGQVIEP